MSAPQAPLTHEFGDFELDIARRVLTTRAGAPVDITGRVLDALIYMVERPGQLIEKRALIEAVWPNVVVEEGNLSQTIHSLRKALGEKAGEHRYIATVPGRGYQFVAEVRTRGPQVTPPVPAIAPANPSTPGSDARVAPNAPAAPAAHRTRWLIAAGVLALLLFAVVVVMRRGHERPMTAVAIPSHPSIAVLPFVDMSDEQDQVHFAEGLSEEILNTLAHADNLRVTARTSSFSFKGENVDIRTIAQRLAVSHVLEGSVRKAGDRLRITAQLIDASNSAHVWSDTYDRDVHDIFGVQREIATAVADALKVSLAHEGPRRAETASAEAYEHYLQGRHLFNRRSPGDLLQAKAHFESALRIDPSYARAWSGLAGVYFVGRYERVDLPDSLKKWAEAVERATTLDPELAEGHIRAAQYYMHEGDEASATAEVDRATALDPQDPMVIAISLSDAVDTGRLADAVEIQRRMVSIDPLSASQRGNLGAMLMATGKLQEAQAELERALELSPAGVSTLTGITDVLLLQGRADEALEVASRMPAGNERDGRLAMAQFARGDTRAAEATLARLQAQTKDPDFDPSVAFVLAEVFASRKDSDRAFEWLARAFPRTERQAELQPTWALLQNLQVSPHMQSLRADPRWGPLVEDVKSRLWWHKPADGSSGAAPAAQP